MKLKFILPSGINAKDIVYDEENGEITMDLVFFGGGRKCYAGVIQSVSRDKVLFNGVVEVSGQTARIAVSDRTRPVTPLIERPKNK